MDNSIGVLVRFYYNKSMDPLTFSGIKNIEHKGNVICDFSDMLSNMDKSCVNEDWTYIPLNVIDKDLSEDKFIELIKNKDEPILFKISEYTESEFASKQIPVYEAKDDYECEITDNVNKFICGSSCGSCAFCSGCSSHRLN